jgi:hypothetical protein
MYSSGRFKHTNHQSISTSTGILFIWNTVLVQFIHLCVVNCSSQLPILQLSTDDFCLQYTNFRYLKKN